MSVAAMDTLAPRVAGLSRLSSVDWPDRLVATVFFQGCPWDCRYCHNPDLIDPHTAGSISWADVHAFLQRRRQLLDGVVFSGGEPTMQAALRPAIDEVRELGFTVGLHTAGAFPAALDAVLEHVDWIGLDIKANESDYATVTARRGSGTHAWRSLEKVLAAADRADGDRVLGYEVRTTVHPDLTDAATLRGLGERLLAEGVASWALQRVRAVGSRMTTRSPGDGSPDLVGQIAAEFDGRFAHLTTR
ncbi:anaerobic ribonucleoside-triphosphate reductase activating protein [Microbacterium sediminicola]|uniref:Anaerobic ribonucleoside-triphosphate reductase activating protein n=1 Tax=Microbacterium sediminicola TaxID=415210 RepID=A0ABN2HZC5_9MICO